MVTVIYPAADFYTGPDLNSDSIDIVGVKPPVTYANGLVSLTNTASQPVTYFDTDVTLADNSDGSVATQKATKAYVDGITGAGGPTFITMQPTEMDFTVASVETMVLEKGKLSLTSPTGTNPATFEVDSGGVLIPTAALIETPSLVSSINSTDSAIAGDGAITTTGGIGVAKNISCGGRITCKPYLKIYSPDATQEGIFTSQDSGYLTLAVTGNRFVTDARIEELDSTDSSSYITGSMKTAGGLGVTKKINCGDTITSAGLATTSPNGTKTLTTSVDNTTGNVSVLNSAADTVCAFGDSTHTNPLHIWGNQTYPHIKLFNTNTATNMTMNVSATGDVTMDCSGHDWFFSNTDSVRLSNTTDSTSSTTGVLICSGGAGFAKKINCADTISCTPTLNLISPDGTKTTSLSGDDSGYLTILPNNTKMYCGTSAINASLSIYRQAALPQLYLNNGAVNTASFYVDNAGDLTIDASGNDLNLASTDAIHVLNTTDSTSAVTGALQCLGGLGLTKKIYCDDTITGKTTYTLLSPDGTRTMTTTRADSDLCNINFTGTTGLAYYQIGTSTANGVQVVIVSPTANAQLSLRYDITKLANFTVGFGGDLTIDCSGNDLNFHSSDAVHVLNTVDSTSKATGALQCSGGLGVIKSVYAQSYYFGSADSKAEDLQLIQHVKMTGAAAASYSVFRGNSYAYTFPAGSDKELYFEAQLPHTRKFSSNVAFHVHWAPPDANAGNVTWAIDYTVAETGAVFPTTSALTNITVAAPGVAYQHTLSYFADLFLNQTTPSACILGRLRRIGSTDTYGSEVALVGFDLHYLIDKLGGT